MLLSAFDDYPVHQTAEPVALVATSDRNFNDRYYFNVHEGSDAFMLVLGFGQYPNLGTQDAFVAIRKGEKQVVLRSSRELGDRDDLTCGPFRLEVIEPLNVLRVIVEESNGVSVDLRFTGAHPPALEPRQYVRRDARIIWDLLRFGQCGTYSGWFAIDGQRHDLGATAMGFRDRSWGIRPLGEPEPAGRYIKHKADFAWLYTVAQFDDCALMLKLHVANSGARLLEEATLIWNDPAKQPKHLGPIDFDIKMDGGGRYLSELRFSGADLGEIIIRQQLPLYLMAGTGYSEAPDWRNGMYQGLLKTERVDFDMHADRAKLNGILDTVASFEWNGRIGHGLLEYGFHGDFDRAGIAGSGWWNAPAESGTKESVEA